MIVIALAACVPVFGCSKKSDSGSSTDKATKDDGKKSKGDDDDDSAEFSRGDVLKHVPKTCDMARAYVDYAGLVADPALKVNAGKIDDKIAQGLKGDQGKKAEEALKILKKAKIDPGTDIKEFAVCANGQDDVVLVLGGDFAGKDVLGAIQKLSALDDDPDKAMKKKDADGFSYLKGKGKGVIAQLTPNVFGIADSPDTLGDLVKANDQSSKFDAGKGRLIVVKGASKKDGIDDGELQLTNKGDNLELGVTATLSGKAMKQLAGSSDPDQAKQAIKQALQEVAKMVDKSPASDLADDLRDAKVKLDGNTLSVTMKIPNKDLAKSLQNLIDMNESDLEQLANK
jgi:hypothetical protein